MLKIVADDKIPFLADLLRGRCELVLRPGAAIAPADLRDADALIVRTRTKCDRALLAGSRVRFVATATIGYDHIAVDELAALGIGWTNCPGCNAGSVKQYITAALLELAARHGFTLPGRTLGVIGAGHVGTLVAAAGAALGMRVLCNDPPRAAREGAAGFASLEQVLAEGDWVTMHVPLDATTRHLAGRDFLNRMKREAFFLNSSRGEVCDNAALREALKMRRIAGAVLDVWENEPEIDRGLLALTDFATPHIAGYSTDGKANGTAWSVAAVADYFGAPELSGLKIATLPAPATPEFAWNGLRDAVSRSYAIAEDDAALRREPEKFEFWRGNYRVRREFPAFRVSGAPPEWRATLRALGFRLAEDERA